MTRRLPLYALLALLAASSASAGSWLQDEAAETTATETPSAAERLGIRPGSHEFQIFAGGFVGDVAYSNDKVVPPLNGDPVAFRIELDSSASFGIGYFYQAHEHWALGATLTRTSSELAFRDPFDRAASEEFLLAATVDTIAVGDISDEQKLAVLDRVEAHSQPQDVDLTMLDFSAVYIVNPEGPWIGEFGAGLGWATLSADQDQLVWEQLLHSECDITDLNCVIFLANEIDDPTNGTGCPAGDDPCEVLETQGNLSFHVLAGLRYAFTDKVQFRVGGKLKQISALTDPGDSQVTMEGNVGLVFRFGGD